ncbi:hypothetical protein HWB92_gp184 [Serratia phage vB_SmaA_3M]|uniref:Uncharacterized protein n=1 Tax=Serratia phage vB_SmaA_3M TaxID=2419930 RepID=A0A3G2YSE3_9CAUD|nr:hypothetical protein HWB92_gp184 [Serratia phage vB_SmaA_3M]AYP28442.1 hypothetical protein 3M_186c [Serratia phage vB_SmaA_3M]
MAVPRTKTVEFEVGGVKLYHHFAQDSHGSVSNTFMADGRVVSYSEFNKIIKDSLEEAIPYISTALGMVKTGGTA